MKNQILYILLTLISLLTKNVVSQETINTDTLNLEKKLEIAQNFAFEGQRDTARTILYDILNKKADFYDAKVLLARTHAWDNNFDSARYIYHQILNKKQGYKEAVDGLIDVEFWDKDYDTAIYYCNYGLKYHPKENYYTIRKAKIFLEKGNVNEAYNQLMIVKAKDSANEEVANLLNDERFILNNDKIQLEYLHEWFNEPYQRKWDLASFSYQNKTDWGTFVGRIYSGSLSVHLTDTIKEDINSTGFQFEGEAYPKIDERHYLYLGLSLSPDYFFPKSRFGAEIYRKLSNQGEISLGLRLLNFGNSESAIQKVTIYTASYNKYFNDLWFSLRAYYANSSEVSSWTYDLQGRKYFNSPETYVFAEFIFGSSPSELSFLLKNYDNPENYFLSSQKFRFGIQKLFKKRWTFFASFSVEDSEYYYKRVKGYNLINAIELRLGYFLPYGK